MSPIPKRLGHIWIGPKPAPTEWMQTWPGLHPDWSYTVFGNDCLTGYPFRLRALINEYAWRGAWAGVQDMMRYELLFRYGGFMADADAICLHPVDELLDAPRAYTVFDRPDTDPLRGVCPILACQPGNPFVGAVIDELATLHPGDLRKPEVSTGNRFVMRMIRQLNPGPDLLKIFPTHYFIPWQKSAPKVWYDGPDRIYAEQKWGTSMWSYNRAGGPSDIVLDDTALAAGHQAILDRLAGATGVKMAPDAATTQARKHRADDLGRTVPDLLASPAVRQDFHDLGTALIAGMQARQRLPKFQGLHFYRHMQGTPIADGSLRSRSTLMRNALLGWLGTSRHALVLGFDTGHLIAAALHLDPTLRITAVDAGRWADGRDPNPPERRAYVPIAAEWLGARFGDRLTIMTGADETRLADAPPGGPVDLVVVAHADVHALKSVAAVWPHLAPDAMILGASPTGTGGLALADRLRVQDLIYLPILSLDFGPTVAACSLHGP